MAVATPLVLEVRPIAVTTRTAVVPRQKARTLPIAYLVSPTRQMVVVVCTRLEGWTLLVQASTLVTTLAVVVVVTHLCTVVVKARSLKSSWWMRQATHCQHHWCRLS